MSQAEFKLFGFTAAKGVPPTFIEPVFCQGKNLYVQSGVTVDGNIKGFIKYKESVDLIEQQNEEVSKEGDPCIYAVMERGGRLIYGDRSYVSRYLSQNLRSYMDSPYFLKDCIEFTGVSIPEFSIVESSQDLLELSVAVSSIRKFFKKSKKARRFIVIEFGDGKSLKNKADFSAGNNMKAKTIFGEWLNFVEETKHPIVKSKRWQNIEKSFLACYDSEHKLPERSTLYHLDACQRIIDFQENDSAWINLEKKRSIPELDDLVCRYNERQTPSEDTDYRAVGTELQFTRRTPVSEGRNNITSSYYTWVYSAIKSESIKKFEIVLHIYFLSLAVKEAFQSEDDSETD